MLTTSWITLQNQKRIAVSAKTAYIAVAADLLRALMAPQIGTIAVDEAWYLDAYPDVAAAVRQGLVGGAVEHFVQSGYFEDRMPYSIRVDEAWYREQYADVAGAVADGTFQSGQEHYETVGYREGRYPYPGFALRQAD